METPSTSDPVRLVALAAEVENEGQYNTAKLLRAAASSIVNRMATTLDVPSEPKRQAAELEAIASALEESHTRELSGALRAAAESIRAGGVVLYQDAPDPFVCRICGHVEMSPFSDRCPHCGRWPNTAARFRPIYWARASTPPESVALLESTPSIVVRAFEVGVSDSAGPDGGWSAHETLEHLHNAQQIFSGRIDQLLEGGEPELASVMVWAMDGDAVDTETLLQSYLDLRSNILDRLHNAPAGAWWNIGHHTEFGSVTLAEQVSYLANHEPTHLSQLIDAAGGVGG
jgi:predicted Zn-ribbon and HTH transcriptional regulator